jgi:outer membrane receptor protein involved in Fe transport
MSKGRTDARARRGLLTALLASTALTAASTAIAQEGGAALETVVVTAEKRSEDIQKAPLSILAFNTEKLSELHVASFDDYAKYLPSVSYTTAGPGFAEVYMRGVASGENGNHSGPLPSVGMYLDEQPITTIGGALDIHVYDIARVEALSGPQGTLYGASSQSGTIRIITNKPDTSGFSAAYDVGANTVSHGSVGGVAEGYVNIPITDHTAIRLVAWDEHDGGYVDNIAGTNAAAGIVDGVRTYPNATLFSEAAGGGPITISNVGHTRNDYNSVDTYGGRMALRFDLDDNWTITPTLMGQEAREGGVFAYDPAVGFLKITHFLPEYSNDRWYQGALTIQGKVFNLDLTYAGAYMERLITAKSDYSDYSYFYDQLYGSGGSYVFHDDGGNVIDPSQAIWGRDHFTKMSNEIRVASSQDDRLRFVAGLFAQRQGHFIQQRYVIQGLESDYSVTGWPNTIWLTEQERVDRDYAAFTEISYDILPKLTFTAGARGYIANNSLLGFFGYSAGYSGSTGEAICFPDKIVGHAPCTDLDKHVYEKGYTHKLNATWHIDDDRMLYATWSTGFRPGGINRNGNLPPYHSDFLTNYEIGWKTGWLGGRMRFNGALFWEDWDGIQFSTIPPGSNGLTQIFNAGKARILGIESNIDWLIRDGLTLSAAATYTDPELTRDYCLDSTPCNPGEVPDAPKGTQLPITPRFKANGVARDEFKLWGTDAHVQGALVYQGSSWPALIASDRAVLGKLPDYVTADFAAGIDVSNWTLELAIQNAFDAHGQNDRYTECSTGTCAAQVYIVPITPRLISIKFGQKF